MTLGEIAFAVVAYIYFVYVACIAVLFLALWFCVREVRKLYHAWVLIRWIDSGGMR